MSRSAAILVLLATLAIPSALRAADDGLAGRWDLVVHATAGDHPAWLEIVPSGRNVLVGRFVGQFGSARPVARVETDGSAFRFRIPPQFENRTTDLEVEGKLADGGLKGTVTDESGRFIRFEGKRAPALDRPASEPTPWGEAIELFDGKSLAGWKPQHAGIANGWRVRDGVLVNAEPGNNLLTEGTFGDFTLHAEFRYPKGSNGGIYLRGRYEVQVEDGFGAAPESHRIGGVYGFLEPCVNAAKPAGEWQTIDIVLVGRRVTVVLNGERIIDRQTIPGITGGALDSDEGAPGPILLQGDHGPIEFRSITLTPAKA